MNREEIEEKYKWNLNAMYDSKDAFMEDFNETKNKFPQIENYKGHFLDSSDTFLEFMSLLETINRKMEKMYTYTHLAVDVEPENNDMQELHSNIYALAEELENKTVFIDLEILKNIQL